MQMFMATLFSCSVVMSIISLVYVAATPFLSKKYSAKWLYYIWLLVVIGWVFPFRPYLNTYMVPLHIPKMQMIQTKYTIINQNMNVVTNGINRISSIPIWCIVACIWAFGVVGMIGYHTWRHYRFLKMVNRWSEDITNHDLLYLLDDLKSELNINKQVDIKTCFSITSPMMIGFLHPTILLPSVDNDSDELILILRHELNHLKRNDLWYKALVLFTIAVHWFNPVVYFVARTIEVQCEISCDELLVRETSIQKRKQYSETLIGAIRNGVNIHTAFSTDFYSPGKVIRTRILRIMDTTKKRAGFALLCLVLMAVIGSGIAYASDLTYDASKDIQIINVNVKKLDRGNIICFKGPYQLNAGDIVRYDITSDNNEDLYVDAIYSNSITYGKSISKQCFIGYCIKYPNCQATVNSLSAGNYCLLIKFKNLEGARNIKGTIEIIKGKDNN